MWPPSCLCSALSVRCALALTHIGDEVSGIQCPRHATAPLKLSGALWLCPMAPVAQRLHSWDSDHPDAPRLGDAYDWTKDRNMGLASVSERRLPFMRYLQTVLWFMWDGVATF